MECNELMIIVVVLVLFLLYHNREKFETLNKLFSPPTTTLDELKQINSNYGRKTKAWGDVTDN